ncbi:hypothetical protein [Lactobacillus gigeriorum]|uniref:hypothetical protein n=1 Tax=Lactobacillus gigeriorum TaxID=1203069 RepID=UPI00058EFA5E|nr:hypothetical protein [Lactobacillus gigeriorum]
MLSNQPTIRRLEAVFSLQKIEPLSKKCKINELIIKAINFGKGMATPFFYLSYGIFTGYKGE